MLSNVSLHLSAVSATGNEVSNASHCAFSFTSECPMEMLAVEADTKHLVIKIE